MIKTEKLLRKFYFIASKQQCLPACPFSRVLRASFLLYIGEACGHPSWHLGPWHAYLPSLLLCGDWQHKEMIIVRLTRERPSPQGRTSLTPISR